jgi:ribosome maturation factor RimP
VDIITEIENIIKEPINAKGYDIVRIMIGGNHRKTLQIMIENQDERPIRIEDCEVVSRLTSVLLDQRDPFPENYVLEISSPGLDRPLMKPKDFQRFVGHEIIVKTYHLIEKRKVFVGVLEGATEEKISLSIQNEKNEKFSVEVPYGDVRSAKLYVRYP